MGHHNFCTGIDILFGELNGTYNDRSIRRDGDCSSGLFSATKIWLLLMVTLTW